MLELKDRKLGVKATFEELERALDEASSQVGELASEIEAVLDALAAEIRS